LLNEKGAHRLDQSLCRKAASVRNKGGEMLGLSDRQETVAVIFGGRSSEHEVSLRSAAFVLKSIPSSMRVIPVGITYDGRWLSLEGSFTARDFKGVVAEDLAVMLEGGAPLSMGGSRPVETLFVPAPFAVANALPESTVRLINLEAGVFFPALHGPNGEDGRLQGLFDLAEVAYVGPDHTASANGMDKSVAKRLAERAGLPLLKWQEVSQAQFNDAPQEVLNRLIAAIPLPVFVKPNALGSAVGVSRAKTREELEQAIADALRFDERVLVEEEAHGTEVECAFLGTPLHPRISQPGEIAPEDFYSYEEKYSAESKASLFVPARLDSAAAQQVRALSIEVVRALQLEGMARIDFWWRASSRQFYFNEVNTLPGMTSISMFPKLWELEGLDGPTWIAEALVLAKERLRRRSARRIKF
jgi:D-alanine-D-alanine ligase